MAKTDNKEESAALKGLLALEEERKNSLEYQREQITKIRLEISEQKSIYTGLVAQQIKSLDLDLQKVKTLTDIAGVYMKEVQAVDDLLLKRNMVSTGLKGEYAQLLTSYMLENDIADLSTKAVQDFVKELKHRQHVNEEVEKQVELYESLANYQLEVLEETEKLGKEYALLGAKIKAIYTDPEFRKTFLKGLFLEQAIEKTEELSEAFGEFRKEGLTVSQAFKETGVAVGATFSLSGASIEENAQLMAGLAESMGNMNSITTNTVTEVGKLAKTLGVSAMEAGKLQGQLMNMPGATAESATSTMEFAGALAKAAHVAPGAVMKDMAANAEEIAINTKNGGKDMAVVSVAAHKLGVEMSSLTKMSAGLLDYENSINKQMEASVLLGREINLDKAREAALNGDILGATKEMLQNVGGEAEFNKMNVLQRKALADSMGVSVSDLSKMVKNQDKLTNLTEEQQMALADGSMTMDEVLANTGGVAKNLFSSAASLGGMVVGGIEFTKGLKEGLSITKGLIGGFKEGSGALGKLGGALKGGLGLGKKIEAPPPPPTPEIPKTDALADSGKKMSGGGMMSGFKKNMKALASGFKEMGKPGVLVGVGNTVLAVPVLVLAIAALPFLALFGTFSYSNLKKNFASLADGLSKMGTGPVALGSLNLMLFAVAGVIGLAAIPFMSFMMLGKFIGAGLKGLAGGLKALGNPAVAFGILMLSVLVLSVGAGMMMFGVGVGIAAAGMSLLMKSISDMPIENLLIMPIALTGIAIGLGLLAVAAMLAAPGLILASVGLAMMILPLAALSMIASTGAINMLGNGLKLMGDAGPGLGLVAISMMGIGAGLGMVALAGLAALPVIGALIALATVAPALVGLGAALGGIFDGGGGGKKEDKMDTLIAKIDTLIGVASKGGVINMDGKKVGEVVRQGLNTTGIR